MINLEAIVDQIAASRKYKHICNQVIYRLAAEEAAKHRSAKEVVKAVKGRLHQAFGAYNLGTNKRLKEKVASIPPGVSLESPLLREICTDILGDHASTKERLSCVESFFGEVVAVTGYPQSIVDVACGLWPFALPWMQAAPNLVYHAWDIDYEVIEIINSFFTKLKLPPLAEAVDVIGGLPQIGCHVAFVLKFLPIAERQKTGVSGDILRALQAEFIVVSFPVRSLSGRDRGMRDNYERFFQELIAGEFMVLKEVVIGNELVYIVRRIG